MQHEFVTYNELHPSTDFCRLTPSRRVIVRLHNASAVAREKSKLQIGSISPSLQRRPCWAGIRVQHVHLISYLIVSKRFLEY